MDLSKLTDEQIKVATKVIDAAEKYGINPDFVLPMVQIESNFEPGAKSKAGAVGPMQLMPKTAEGLKVDPNDVDQNIDGGMRFLKQLVDNKKFGGDPEKIFAAYNAGPNHKFFETGDMADLPDETVKHVVKIYNLYGDNVPAMTVSQAEKTGEDSDIPQVGSSENPYGEDTVPTWDADKESRDMQRLSAGVLGAGAGTMAGSVYAAKAPVVRIAQRVGLLPGGKPISPADAANLVQQTMTANAPQSVVRKPHGGENWQKSLTGISLPGAQMDKASLDLAKNMQNVVGIGGAPGFTGGTITEGGVILSPQDAAAIKAKQQAMLQPRVRQPSIVSKVPAAILGASPIKGGLAGFGIGYGAQDVADKMRQGDTSGAAVSGAGVLGDIMALAPTATKVGAKVAPIGGALSSSAEAARRMREKDYVGALTSALGAAGPYVAPFALGPEVGIPVGIGLALGSPMANELKDYIQRKMAE